MIQYPETGGTDERRTGKDQGAIVKYIIMQGKLIILAAPSGSGKTTLVNYLLHQDLPVAFSVSACSRKKRPHEIDGRDYYFLSVDEFKERVLQNAFVEWEEVYRDHFYGTLKSEVERIWAGGLNVIFDVDVVGGINIKRQYGDRALAIFVMPPSVKELEKRLTGRSTESSDQVRERISKAEGEIAQAGKFDVVIINDNLDKAKQEALKAVTEFLNNPLIGNDDKPAS